MWKAQQIEPLVHERATKKNVSGIGSELTYRLLLWSPSSTSRKAAVAIVTPKPEDYSEFFIDIHLAIGEATL